MYCSNCGVATQNNAFCVQCGMRLSPEPVVMVPTTPQMPPIPAKDPSNTQANVALGFGIASVVFWEFLLPPLVAIVLGILALSRAKQLEEQGISRTGKAKAIVGLCLGGLYLFVALVYLGGA